MPALVAGAAWTVAALALNREPERLRRAAKVFIPAGLIFFLWAGPVIRHLILHGGFVNVSPSLGREWPLWTALAAWGILGPLAALGAFVTKRTPATRTIAGFGLATAALLGLAIARGAFDWALAGNATVLHQGRIWPIAHLIGGAFAGVGLWWLWTRFSQMRAVRLALFAVLLFAGVASPVLASTSLTNAMKDGQEGYPYTNANFDEDSFIARAAAELGPHDTVLVEGTPGLRDDLAFHLFSFSGVRLARFDDPRLATNDLRIRYEDLAREWDAAIQGEGYQADYFATPASEAFGAPGAARGFFAGEEWVLVHNPASNVEE